MKLLRDLTVSDLESTPIWEHRGDGLSAEIWPAGTFLDPNIRGYIARTEFVLANGDQRHGYCSPQDPSGLDYIQPVIIIGTRHIDLFDDQRIAVSDSAAVAKALGLNVDEVYPMRYRCLVPFEGFCWEDTIEPT